MIWKGSNQLPVVSTYRADKRAGVAPAAEILKPALYRGGYQDPGPRPKAELTRLELTNFALSPFRTE